MNNMLFVISLSIMFLSLLLLSILCEENKHFS